MAEDSRRERQRRNLEDVGLGIRLLQDLHGIELRLVELEGRMDATSRTRLGDIRRSFRRVSRRLVADALVPALSGFLVSAKAAERQVKALAPEDWKAVVEMVSGDRHYRDNVWVYYLGLVARTLGEVPTLDDLARWWREILRRYPDMVENAELEHLGFVDKALYCLDALRERDR